MILMWNVHGLLSKKSLVRGVEYFLLKNKIFDWKQAYFADFHKISTKKVLKVLIEKFLWVGTPCSALFNGDSYFEVCYSRNAGTLVFSGYGHSGATQVYIITQNSNWNKVESSDKYLSSFQNPGSSSYYNWNKFG